ncbi:MAG TPA: hypothetical protein VHF07_01195 [Nitrospiraceae bacterium]|nr:hypothetical protein [Nitrospiraceae bacterium]
MKPARPAGIPLLACCRRRFLTIGILLSGVGLIGPLISSASAESSSEAIRDAPVDVSPGGNYVAGTTVRIPGQRLLFKVPAQWHATVFEDAELPFLISDEGRSMGMMFPLSHASVEDIESELAQPLSLSQGLVFVPTGVLTRTDSRLRRSYVSESTVGRALAVNGPADQWIIYFLMGPAGESETYDAILDRLADSTEFNVTDGDSPPRQGI